MRVTSRPSRSGRATGPRLALGAIAIVLPLAAAAELSNDSMLGAGLRSRPAYDGADARHTEIVPVIRYLGEPWFLRSTQGVLEGGLRTALASGLHLGTQLAYVRISAIVDARFSLIVDGETASSRTRRGGAQAPGRNVAQPSTISLKRSAARGVAGPVLGLD